MERKGIFILILLVSFFVVTQAQAADIHLKWDRVPGDVTGYRIYYGHVSGNYPNHIDAGNVTEYIIKNFSPDSAYFFVVRAYNSAGESGNSNEVSWPKLSIDTSSSKINNPYTTVSFEANVQPEPIHATYKWNFGDGSGIKSVSKPSINHEFSSKGNYTVTLSIVFGDGSSLRKIIKISVEDEKPETPVARITALNQTD